MEITYANAPPIVNANFADQSMRRTILVEKIVMDFKYRRIIQELTDAYMKDVSEWYEYVIDVGDTWCICGDIFF